MSATSTIFAFGIVNLAMLGWLAAAAAPILIHLWSRRKYRETSWAAMEYLLAAVRRQTRRLRVEQLLLLAIRTLIVVLLVLAVAEPFLERIGLASTAGGRTHRVLVVDGSYSMAFEAGEKTRFQHAKELACQIVEQGRQGDASTLVLMSAPPRVIVGTPALEPGQMVAEIGNLKRPDTTSDLPATVTMVHALVRRIQRDHSGLSQHEVYFLSDLQRVGWVPERTGAALEEFRKQSRELAELATLVVIDAGQAGAVNTAVTGLSCSEGVPGVGQSVGLEVSLKRFGPQRPQGQRVELLVDGRHVGQKRSAAADETTVTFGYRFETAGEHTVEVRAPGDTLEVDNHRWMAIPVRQSIRVLCVNGRPTGEPFGGATDWLQRALSPHAQRAGPSPVEVDVASESAVRERSLGQYDCVFLCDVAQFTSGEARLLETYLGNGGSLVFFLGDQVLRERYNRELCGGVGEARVLPARLGPVVEHPIEQLDPMEYRHPIVQPFRGREKAGLLSTPVYRYFKLEVPERLRAGIALKTAGGDPLIVAEAIRRGRVVLVATSADVSWTDMPVWTSYVPLVQEILVWCLGGQLVQRNVEVGQPIGGSIATPVADVPLDVRGPVGRAKRVPVRSDGEYGTWSYAETTTAGMYSAEFGPPVGRSKQFAVNVNTIESDLAQLDEGQLRSEVWPDVELLYQTTWQDGVVDDGDRLPSGPIARQWHLHVDLLYGVLGLLFLETFLAWRFGHHST